MTSTLPPLVQALSGAVGSASANGLVYPLDLVTTRIQLAQRRQNTGIRAALHILHRTVTKKGLLRVYDGLATDTGATLLSNFFYFYIYTFLRDTVVNRRSSATKQKSAVKLSLLYELVLGFIAGVLSRAISTPLNLVTLRLQTDNHDDDDDEEAEESGIMSVMKRIYAEDGLVGFWRGFSTSILLSLNPSITLAFFQVFRRALAYGRSRRSPGSPVMVNPSPREAFIGAAIANSIAVTLLYPLILAKTRLSVSSSANSSLASVLVDAYEGRTEKSAGLPKDERAKRVKRQDGIAGLYQGLPIQIIKGFFSQGVTFLVKGRIEQIVVAAYLRRKARGL
ncbi:mitochondrial carrier domain-containing protein [Mycena floridula]|nr:mitochondrial carrier domain-containing protein [Mycena floridula]